MVRAVRARLDSCVLIAQNEFGLGSFANRPDEVNFKPGKKHGKPQIAQMTQIKNSILLTWTSRKKELRGKGEKGEQEKKLNP